MESILSLSLNPAIDVSSEAESVRSTQKVRTSNETYDPGGGGVNVARVITTLGGDVHLQYMAGGVTGALLDELLEREKIRRSQTRISGNTRISFTVHDRQSGLEYRFVAGGPVVLPTELDAGLEAIKRRDFRYLVASGSLPLGAPDDFLAKVAAIVAAKGARLILDSSGPGLKRTLAKSSVYLVKPNLDELEELVGHELDEQAARQAAADLVGRGVAEMVALTMGASGAILATKRCVLCLPAVETKVRSAVGAGDSFLGAMTYALSENWGAEDAFVFGLAGGAAALLRPGTKLVRREDVLRLYNEATSPSAAVPALDEQAG